jgi:ribosomal protein S14
MNKNFINFLKIKLKRKLFLKNELKRKILKSIVQNQQLKPLKRQYGYYKLIKNASTFLKIKNVCLLTSRQSSVSNNFYFSRHVLKKMLNVNKLQNVKIRSW